jgi:hypothetical protein
MYPHEDAPFVKLTTQEHALVSSTYMGGENACRKLCPASRWIGECILLVCTSADFAFVFDLLKSTVILPGDKNWIPEMWRGQETVEWRELTMLIWVRKGLLWAAVSLSRGWERSRQRLSASSFRSKVTLWMPYGAPGRYWSITQTHGQHLTVKHRHANGIWSCSTSCFESGWGDRHEDPLEEGCLDAFKELTNTKAHY